MAPMIFLDPPQHDSSIDEANLMLSYLQSRFSPTAVGVAAMIVLVPLLYGCATIVRGSSQDVRVTSDPSNAEVIVNGEDRGSTPTTLNLDTGRDYQIEFDRDGYTSETVNVTKDFTIGWPIFGNIFSWGIIGIVVDVANGSAYQLSPEQVEAALESTSAEVNVPEDSDVHIALFPKNQVKDAVSLSEATKLELKTEAQSAR